MNNVIFGIPFYKQHIDPSLFDKQSIIQKIAKNYSIDNYRNSWDNDSFFSSNLHHAHADWHNPKFEKIDFQPLTEIYKKHIECFFDTFEIDHYRYEFKIDNYTCYGKNQHMVEHGHITFDFSAIHYIKFDHKLHKPTIFKNPIIWSNFTGELFSKKLQSGLDNLYNSWLRDYYQLGALEDDFIIFPALLRHFVPPSTSDELRMAVVCNIKILDK